MRPKSKCRILNAASAAFILLGMMAIVWSVASPIEPQVVDQVAPHNFQATTRIPGPTSEEFSQLLTKRLQGPPPKPKTRLPTVKPTIPWPNIALHSILYGEKSKLVVFIANDNTKVTCREGEKVGEVLVERIETDRIITSFRGEQRIFLTNGRYETSLK